MNGFASNQVPNTNDLPGNPPAPGFNLPPAPKPDLPQDPMGGAEGKNESLDDFETRLANLKKM